ncbi:LysR family transcriptional regulator [Pseudomethylobacillus aquaticus]|uniref:LysR family transcriptional regulator n=1 Tax=Pseudomethylobacillus aquaticus TaxID=2676064 RepID=A0A3N0V0N5_9PROT|nr:LysR family transcriptional regulator [Pseudomethylobacillus aquaticus]ROH86265.1 LysR family transcriptional regulator [Pseudomethylobacillus aquaticus]
MTKTNHPNEDRLTALESFVAVAQKRSFAAASLDLDISASALSRRISRLEASLGTRLFQRSTRHVSLTEAGTLYLSHVTEALTHMGRAQAAISDYGHEANGRLRVALPTMFGQLHVAPLLPTFMRRYPKVMLELSLSDWYTDIVGEGYDLGVRVGALESSDLIGRKLAYNQRILCCSPDYLQQHGAPASLTELRQHASLQFSTFKAPNYWRLKSESGSNPFKVTQVAITPVLRSDNAETLRQAALGGMGISLMARFIVDDDLKAGRLVRILPDISGEDSWIWAIYPNTPYVPLKVRVFIDFMLEQFAQHKAWGSEWSADHAPV